MRLRGRCLGSLPTVRMLVATRSPVTRGDCPWSGTVRCREGSDHYCQAPSSHPKTLPILEHLYTQEKLWRGLEQPAPKSEPHSSSSPSLISRTAKSHCLQQAFLDSPFSPFESLMFAHTVLGPPCE